MTDAAGPALDLVFGDQSRGATPSQRAATSDQCFVRSQHQLSLWREDAPGRRLNASEALRAYGWDVVRQLADMSAATILKPGADPLKTLQRQMETLGVEPRRAFEAAGWERESVTAFNEGRQVPFRKLERLAQILSLEPDTLGVEAGGSADVELGVRLRELGAGGTNFSTASVLALAEAAWIIRKQYELGALLGESGSILANVSDDDFGGHMAAAWQVGFRLAERTRDLLNMGRSAPIDSMTQLLEERLGIPVIHVELPGTFAGATLSNGGFRGIVINMKGRNANVWIRRMTMAHELGHFLWDPNPRLKRLVVDGYRDIETSFETAKDPVEQRANAFAVEFLAPRDFILDIYTRGSNRDAAVAQIIQAYGVSPTATAYHLSNRLHGAKVDARHLRLEPDTGLMGREELSVGFFKPGKVPMARRGRFAILVGRAERKKLISTDTAASLLACPPSMIDEALAHIRSRDVPGAF